MDKKITVSIATIAHNEEHSIKRMLASVCNQKEQGFVIKEILVISDGSTDGTVKEIKKIRNPRIVVIDDKRRLGQPARIHELLQRFEGDYLVLLDADVVMKDESVIERMIAAFDSGENVSLVAAHMRPLAAKTFLESAINNYRSAREYVEPDFSFGIRVWGAHGCLAYKREFAKSLKIPRNILSVDNFSFYSCIAQGYKHAYTHNAIVFYRSPQNLKDHINQATRHFVGGLQLYEYFDKKLIEREKAVPALINLKLMLYQLLKNPLGYVFLKIINLYCVSKSKKEIRKVNPKWQVVLSTKHL